MDSEGRREEEIIKALSAHLGEGRVIEASVSRERRVFITISPEDLQGALRFLSEEQGFRHLSTITGVDAEDGIEVIYHLNDGKIALSLRVTVPKANPILPTIVDIIPGAVLYEREVHDLFGVVFEGHPNLSPLILPDGWPEGVWPLRKEWDIKRIRRKLKGGKDG